MTKRELILKIRFQNGIENPDLQVNDCRHEPDTGENNARHGGLELLLQSV